MYIELANKCFLITAIFDHSPVWGFILRLYRSQQYPARLWTGNLLGISILSNYSPCMTFHTRIRTDQTVLGWSKNWKRQTQGVMEPNYRSTKNITHLYTYSTWPFRSWLCYAFCKDPWAWCPWSWFVHWPFPISRTLSECKAWTITTIIFLQHVE